jgi:hypothetical protein
MRFDKDSLIARLTIYAACLIAMFAAYQTPQQPIVLLLTMILLLK